MTITVRNTASTSVIVDSTVIEYIGTQKPYAPLSLSPQPHPWDHDTSAQTESWLYVEANVPHGALVQWGADPGSSVSPGADEPVLYCTYTIGPGLEIAATASKSSKMLSQLEFWNLLRILMIARGCKMYLDSYNTVSPPHHTPHSSPTHTPHSSPTHTPHTGMI